MRTSTFIGTQAKGTQVDEILKNAGLDYMVGTQPLFFYAHGTEFEVPNKKVTYRIDDPEQVFGVVGEKYQVCQNNEAFKFVDFMDDITIKLAGQTAAGMVYMIGELPSITTLGDEIKPNIIFQNSHDGWSSVKSTICMLRIICQNQFAYAFKGNNNTISVRHSVNMLDNLKEAREQMTHTYEYIKAYVAEMEKLAATPITKDDIETVIKTIIVKPYEGKKKEITVADENKIIRFKDAYNADDNANFKGTALGLVNAFTDYSTHTPKTKRNTKGFEDRQFITNSIYNPDLNTLMNYVAELAA